MLNEKHLKILEERGLDAELLVMLGVSSSDKLSGDCIAIPYLDGDAVVNHKYRTLGDEKRFMQDADARKVFWNRNAITDPTLKDQPLTITEGEFDAMIAMQCGYQRVVSVPDGAPKQQVEDLDGAKYSYVDEVFQQLRDIDEIILCTDSDPQGINLMNDLALKIGRHRCKWVKYPKDCKDLNEAFVAYGHKAVTETMNRAKWFEVDGVYRMSELAPEPYRKPHETGLIDEHYKIRLGDFTVVTGIPGHGKTALINDICCRMTCRYGWGVAYASFEQHPQSDHKRNLRTWFNKKKVIHQTDEEKARADDWIDNNFSFIVPGFEDDVTLTWMLERAAASVIQHGVKIVVIDPWNEMDHDRPRGMSLTEYTGFAIKQFKAFARKYQIHLIVAAHPAKQQKKEDGTYSVPTLYDISDSAHWYNKCDVGLVVHRDETGTILRTAKSKYHDQIGVPGDELAVFNISTGGFDIVPEELR